METKLPTRYHYKPNRAESAILTLQCSQKIIYSCVQETPSLLAGSRRSVWSDQWRRVVVHVQSNEDVNNAAILAVEFDPVICAHLEIWLWCSAPAHVDWRTKRRAALSHGWNTRYLFNLGGYFHLNICYLLVLRRHNVRKKVEKVNV